MLPELKVMQQYLDNIIYFQHTINSSEEYHLLTLNLGIAPITGIIDYYEKSSNLLPSGATALKQQLSRQIDIDNCSAFLFFSADIIKHFD